jgi:hypothetical protein
MSGDRHRIVSFFHLERSSGEAPHEYDYRHSVDLRRISRHHPRNYGSGERLSSLIRLKPSGARSSGRALFSCGKPGEDVALPARIL